MASEKNCEGFVHNLLDGASHTCFNCGFPKETHNKHAITVSNSEDEPQPQPQPAPNPNPQQLPTAEIVAISSESEHSEGELLAPVGELPGPEHRPTANVRRRRRQTFSRGQIQEMVAFAHQIGWGLNLHRGDPAIQRFCDSIGITRPRFRVWIHSNKSKYQQHNDDSD